MESKVKMGTIFISKKHSLPISMYFAVYAIPYTTIIMRFMRKYVDKKLTSATKFKNTIKAVHYMSLIL